MAIKNVFMSPLYVWNPYFVIFLATAVITFSLSVFALTRSQTRESIYLC